MRISVRSCVSSVVKGEVVNGAVSPAQPMNGSAIAAELGNATTAHELNATAIVEGMVAAAAACGGGDALSRIHARLPLERGSKSRRRFLAVLSIALACAVCALCVLVMLLARRSCTSCRRSWVKALVRPAASTEPSDDPRKGLLQETKSCLRDASASDDNNEGKRRRRRPASARTRAAQRRATWTRRTCRGVVVNQCRARWCVAHARV